jgi:hypothetical protein
MDLAAFIAISYLRDDRFSAVARVCMGWSFLWGWVQGCRFVAESTEPVFDSTTSSKLPTSSLPN